MSFGLEPKNGGQMIWWSNVTWRAVVDLFRKHRLSSDEKLDLLDLHVDTEITAEESIRIADFLEDYLRDLRPGQPFFPDGAWTVPDPTAPRNAENETNAERIRALLMELRDFSRASGGFHVG